MSAIPPHSTFGGPLGKLIAEGRLRPPAHPGGRPTLDRFEILDWLGEGGMGEVLLARDPTRGNEHVAIKLLKTTLARNTYAVRRFLREARLMERLAHPAIVPVLEVLDGREGPCFAMALFKGGNAATLLRDGRPLAPERILAITRPVAEALHYAHGKGVIHRDLKPANLLLRDDGSAALGDFGLARTTFNDSMLDVEHSHRSGTTAYLAPEAAAGEAGDTRVDIYSFGAVLYELLTGRPPYDGATTQEILHRIKRGPPPPVRELQPKAPAPLVVIAEGAMARSVRDRYASMADLSADLDRVGRGQAALGPRGRGAWNFSRRLVKPVAATLAIGSVIAGAWFLWPATRLKEVHSFSLPPLRLGVTPRVAPWTAADRPAIFVTGKDELLIYSVSGEPIGSYALEHAGAREFEVNLLTDVWALPPKVQDGCAEAVMSWTHQVTNLHLLVLKQNLQPWRRFQATGAPAPERRPGTEQSSLTGRIVTDLNRDGRRELLATVNSGFALRPRGLICFDFESETQLWLRAIAPSPLDLALIDLDQDGTKEVVLGSHAVDNNSRLADGTDDLHSYLYAFSGTGRPLWTTRLGDVYTQSRPLVADVDGDGRAELMAWVHAKADFRSNDVGRIVRLDGGGKTSSPYDAGATLLSCAAADLNGDGACEIIGTDARGFVHVLGGDLKPLQLVELVPLRGDSTNKLASHDFVDLRLIAVTNLDRTTAPEMVLTSQQVRFVSGLNPGSAGGEANVRHGQDVSVHVLDANLKVLATYRAADQWEETAGLSVDLADVDADGRPELFVFAKHRVTVLGFRR
jgi:serine/threonine protein kinase